MHLIVFFGTHLSHLSILIDRYASHLSAPTEPFRLDPNGVGCIPGLPYRQPSAESRSKRQGDNRQVRGTADQRHLRGHMGTCFQASTPRRPAAPSINIQDEICLKNQLERQRQITRDTVLKAQVNRLQRSVTYQLNKLRNSAAICWNAWTVTTSRYDR
jgi:hypothetical protein